LNGVTWRVSDPEAQPAGDAQVPSEHQHPATCSAPPEGASQDAVTVSRSRDRTDTLQQPATFQSAFDGYRLLPRWRGLVQGPWGSAPNFWALAEETVRYKTQMISDGTGKEQHEKER